MMKYARLHHSRKHSDSQGVYAFFNGAETYAPVSAGTAEGMPEDKGGGNFYGYRLGAAVQRAMAMRERGSPCKAEDIKGIGGMRDIYMSGLTYSPPLPYNAEMTEEEIFHAAIKPQSVKFTRFCPDLDGVHQEFGRISNGKQNLEIFGVYRCVEEDIGENQGVKKRNFVKRLCRQLFGRRKKSSAMKSVGIAEGQLEQLEKRGSV
ncbi:uncharacterized protein LOC131039941 [Cryptomeria japonica]|uniref:uncharacterized protein LOC131039941 n=1 Tax=Cryptomeria japonica TaxID=3369 RepID=UPI0027DA5CF8|nr:uncharacterized protein LOC131039941 [Cryptomeria japonica]